MAIAPWDIDLNSDPINPTDTPVWIDLFFVDPLFKIHTDFILKQVGRRVFSSTSTSLKKVVHIRRCVLVNLEKPVPGQVEIDMNSEGSTRIDVGYRSLPFTYRFWYEKGHPEKLYIKRRREVEHTQLQLELDKAKSILARALDADSFQPVVNKANLWKGKGVASGLGTSGTEEANSPHASIPGLIPISIRRDSQADAHKLKQVVPPQRSEMSCRAEGESSRIN